MKASELISQLTKLVEEYGDKTVETSYCLPDASLSFDDILEIYYENRKFIIG